VKLLTNAQYKKITREHYGKGYKKGYKNGYNEGFDRGRDEEKRIITERKKNLQSYKEADVMIQSIELHSFTVDDYPILYTVKFKSPNGATTEIDLTFEDQNFSLPDIRKKITEDFFRYIGTSKK